MKTVTFDEAKWKLVPLRASTGMAKANADAWLDCGSKLILNRAMAGADAAIAAAPEHPAADSAETNHDDLAVDAVAIAMRVKLAEKRAQGYGGWEDKSNCPVERLQSMIVEHLAKGDPVDIGNFAMMLWNRGEPTAAPEHPAVSVEPVARIDVRDPDIKHLHWFTALQALPEGMLLYASPQSDADKRDAERYRWLREQPNNTDAPRIDVVHWTFSNESANDGTGLRLEELDSAIDAAIASQKGTGHE